MQKMAFTLGNSCFFQIFEKPNWIYIYGKITTTPERVIGLLGQIL
jgi:hypothetical protein